MSTSYTVWAYDAVGVAQAAIDDFVDEGGSSFVCQCAVNNVGVLTVNVTEKYAPLFRDPERWLDFRLGLWSRVDTGQERLEMDKTFFVRKVKKRIRRGVRSFQVTGYCNNELLTRAIVAAKAETAAAKKTDQIDDLMKAIVREQLGASAVGIRNRSAYLSVEADTSKGTSTTKGFSHTVVMDVLQELAQQAGTTATPIFFGIVAPTVTTMEFRTRPHQWGGDRTANNTSGNKAVTLSPDDDTLDDVEIEYDYSGEVNYVYVGGSGEDSNRVVEPVFDATRYGMTPLNLREAFISYNNSNEVALLQSVGYAALRDGRPKKRFLATVRNAPQARYREHWFFGDKLTMDADGEVANVRVDSIQLAMQAGVDTIQVQLRSES